MKRLFSLGVALLLSIGAMPLSAADWVSLDDLVKAAGCTPVIDGGTSNTHYLSSCPPANAFDGITFATDNSYRWLGNLQKNAYLKYAIPDDFQMPFQIRGYRVHALSAGDYWRDRAPTAWELYGHTNADAAVDDEGWILLDTQSDVVWPFTVSGASTSNPASFTLEFTISDSLHYNAYKFVPTASNRASTDSWTVGLKELVFLGETVAPTGSLVIQSTPENLGSTSPAYGVVEGLDSGMTVELSADELAYTDTIRYVCSGYCTEVLQADGTWLMETTNLGVRAFTYVSDGQVRRLTWLWEENGYKLTTGVESGLESVTVSPAAESDGYYAVGTEVTLTPVCATDPVSYFKNWYGDIPADATAETSPTIVMDAPKTVYADFSRTWKAVEGVSNQITDGNWTIRISAGSDGTYAVGTGSSGSGIVSGYGTLDLTGVERDTGYRLTSISVAALENRSTLCSLICPESLTVFNRYALNNCNALTNVVLSTRLTSFGLRAIAQCTALKRVTPFLPETLETMEGYVFYGTSALEGDLKLLNPALKSLSGGSFAQVKMTSVEMPYVETVGRYDFEFCTALTNVVFSENLRSISANAFQHCTALRTVTPMFPDTLESIGNSAFFRNPLAGEEMRLAGCVTVGNSNFEGSFVTSVYAPVAQSIGNYGFAWSTSLTNVVLGNRLQSIGSNAFLGCNKLSSVTPFLPGSVTSIGASAFQLCTSLALELEILNPACTNFPSLCFADVPFTKLTLPRNPSVFGSQAFYNCRSGAEIYFTGAAPVSIASRAFTAASYGRYVVYVCRKMDEEGWASYTTELTESDLSSADYPGRGTFGILLDNGRRNWLVHWTSPLLGNTIIRVH